MPTPRKIAVTIAAPRTAPPALTAVVTTPLANILPKRIQNYFPVIFPSQKRLSYIPISIIQTVAPIIQVLELPKVLISVFLAIYSTPIWAVVFIRAPHPALIPDYPAFAADARMAERVFLPI